MHVVAYSFIGAQIAADGGGISGGLGINAWAFISQLVSFLIIFWAMWRWLLPILLKTLQEREDRIRQGIEDADRAKHALDDANARSEQILAEARRQSQETIERAAKVAQQEAARIREEAHQQAEQIAQQNIARIQQEANRARVDLSRLVVNLSIDAAGRVIGRSVDNKDNRRLVEEFVTASNDNTRNN